MALGMNGSCALTHCQSAGKSCSSTPVGIAKQIEKKQAIVKSDEGRRRRRKSCSGLGNGRGFNGTGWSEGEGRGMEQGGCKEKGLHKFFDFTCEISWAFT